jgi:hypothetical protein
MYTDVSNTGSVQSHWIAEICVALGHPAAIEADEAGSTRELLYFTELARAGQYAEMSLMIALASLLAHDM